MMFVPHWEDFFYLFLPAKGNALRGLFFENETERVGEVTNCIALGTARKKPLPKERLFVFENYFAPVRICASLELPSRMTVFSSPSRLAFRASSAMVNS